MHACRTDATPELLIRYAKQLYPVQNVVPDVRGDIYGFHPPPQLLTHPMS